MQHPNFLDHLAVKIFPRYLYPGQLAVTTAKVTVGVLHKLPTSKASWKIMDHLPLEQGSLLKFQGLARNLKISGDVLPNYSVFNIVQALTQMDVTQSSHHISPGDAVIVLPVDRRFIYPAPSAMSSISKTPLYYTADSPPIR